MEKDSKKLSKLVPGKDYVWGIYNKNYADSHTDRYNITDYVLVRGDILKNEKVERKIYSSDIYHDPDYTIVIETEIIVSFKDFEDTYSRFYDDFYDKEGQILMHTTHYNLGKAYPEIEVFLSKEKAIEYLKDITEGHIGGLVKQIEKYQEQIKVYQQNIEDALKVE